MTKKYIKKTPKCMPFGRYPYDVIFKLGADTLTKNLKVGNLNGNQRHTLELMKENLSYHYEHNHWYVVYALVDRLGMSLEAPGSIPEPLPGGTISTK